MSGLTGALRDWADLANQGSWPTLLLGNGFSINLWSSFAYGSLYSQATIDPIPEALFRQLDTTNFELVLECLHHARLTALALRDSTSKIDSLYAEVRDALFEAVSTSHMSWNDFPQPVHDDIAAAIDGFASVYTTNYDLNLYWSMMQGRPQPRVVDFFWASGSCFDPSDVTINAASSTAVYFLHGGLHLWQSDAGVCGKWTNSASGGLLMAARYHASSERRPLFISDGDHKSKLRAIRRSEYLSFCLDRLEGDVGDCVIVGHSLSKQDDHILAALNESETARRFAISIFPGQPEAAIVAEKARLIAAFPRHHVEFFDSTTHPLSAPSLQIGP